MSRFASLRRFARAALAAQLGLFGLLGLIHASAGESQLNWQIVPRFHATPLTFDALVLTNATGQPWSVTRLDFLISHPALRQRNGEWIEPSEGFAYISAREHRLRFTTGGVPPGAYDRIRFHVGLPPAENHAQPAGIPASSPLNPNLNGLHWNWQGGYVFLALEGNWRDTATPGTTSTDVRGYSFHLATDPLLMTVELPMPLELSADGEIRLGLDIARILSGPQVASFNPDSISTHSRTNDALAPQLRRNVEAAFSVESVRSVTAPNPAAPAVLRREIAPTATPYRFSYPGAFPQPALPRDNPLTEEGVALGRDLFFDTRLSGNQRQSCASCHREDRAFTEDRQFSVGAEGQIGARNAPPLFNLAWKTSYFWDGRATTLREQVLQPIQNPLEMYAALPTVVARLSADPTLPGRFARAFGTAEITADRLARALEQFLLTRTSDDSRFDRFQAGQAELSAEEKRGFELFHTEYDPRREQYGADCFHCHGGPLFQSQGFANNGLDAVSADPGRRAVTGRVGDQGRFAVPSLRNVALTAPYMHDGRLATLEDVVAHYCSGVTRSATLDPNLAKHPDGGVPLSPSDQKALVAFLRTLTDQRWITSSATTKSSVTPDRPN